MAAMNIDPTYDSSPPTPDADRRAEIASLAAELANAYEARVVAARELLGLDPEAADRQARGLDATPEATAAMVARIRAQDPRRVSWADLQMLAITDSEAALNLWERITAEARDDLASGHRIARSGSWQGRPWERAQVLALREHLRGDGPPPSGVEAILIDLAAADLNQLLELSAELAMLQATQVGLERDDLKQTGRWRPPHQVAADLIARVERRVEETHRRVLRSLKMLTELRRSSATLIVRHAGQINLGARQVNVAPPPHAGYADAHLPKSTGEGPYRPDGVSEE